MKTKANKNTIKKQFWLTKVVEGLVADLKGPQPDLIIGNHFVEVKQIAGKPIQKQKEAKVKNDLLAAFIEENKKSANSILRIREIAEQYILKYEGIKVDKTKANPPHIMDGAIQLYDTENFQGMSSFYEYFDYEGFHNYVSEKLTAMHQVLILMIASCSKPLRIDKRTQFRNIIKFLFKNLDDSHSKANSFSPSILNYLDFTKHESNLYRSAC